MSGNAAYQAYGKEQAENAAAENFKAGVIDGPSYVADAGWLLLNLQINITGDRTSYKLY
jgi:hypothetical protein